MTDRDTRTETLPQGMVEILTECRSLVQHYIGSTSAMDLLERIDSALKNAAPQRESSDVTVDESVQDAARPAAVAAPRGDAVNLARNWLDAQGPGCGMHITNKGIDTLAKAVLQLDELYRVTMHTDHFAAPGKPITEKGCSECGDPEARNCGAANCPYLVSASAPKWDGIERRDPLKNIRSDEE